MRRRSGNTILETALWIPFIMLLLMGMVNLGRLAYTYYTLHKILYNLARYLGTQQGVNFCDSTDATMAAAEAYAISGTTDEGAPPILANLTPDMLQITIQRNDPTTQTLNTCDCTATGCDASQGGLPPDVIVVSLTEGYPFQPNIPLLPLNPILLKPQVEIPYGGT